VAHHVGHRRKYAGVGGRAIQVRETGNTAHV
jgi:hypothetical protein